MNVIHQHKIIFLHVPKNAGTSILKAFGQQRGNHEKWYYYKEKYPKEWGEYFKFAIIRNPWDRVVSNYEYAKMGKSYWHSVDGNAVYGIHKDYDLLKDRTFQECVHLLKNNRKRFKHPGWEPQFSFICNKKYMPQVKILKYENLTKEFNDIFPEIKLPTLNESKKGKDYKKYYNQETKGIIANIYKKDIEIFKYLF